MKKRLIGSLLFGTLLVSSSSVFVSCADYDDDINANKAEIVAAQQEISKLTSNLSSLQAELNSTKAALEQELKDVQSTLKTQIETAKSELNAAIAAKADQSTVDALVERIHNLENDLTAKEAALNAKIAQCDSAIAALQELIKTKADQSALDAAVQTLQAAINTLDGKKVDTTTYNELVSRVAALETQFASLSKLIDDLKQEKANLESVNNQIALINTQIAALQKSLDDKAAALEKQLGDNFNTLKGLIDNLSAQLTALSAKVDTKADKTELAAAQTALESKIAEVKAELAKYVTTEKFDAAINTLNGIIESLQKAIDAKIATLESTKADKSAVEANATDIATLKQLVLAIQATLATLEENKADKATVANSLESLRSELTALIENKVTKEEYVAKVKDIEQSIIDLEKALRQEYTDADAVLKALIDALEANKADKTELAAVENALKTQISDVQNALTNALNLAVATLNQKIQDTADDLNVKINNVNVDLQAAKKQINEILATIATMQGDLNKVEQKFDALIAQLVAKDGELAKADEKLAEELKALREYAAAKTELEAQKKALQDYQAANDARSKAIEENLAKASKELQDKIAKEEADRKAAITEVYTEISTQAAALDKKISDLAALEAKDKAELLSEIGKSNDRIKKLEDDFAKINDIIDQRVNQKVAAIYLFINRGLKSISLVPQLFVGGIEAIEFLSIQYNPVISASTPWTHPYEGGTKYGGTSGKIRTTEVITIDNGMAEAYYRLNPSTVQRADLQEDKIEYLAATAETRAATVTSPVDFNGINAWAYNGKAGLIKVNLKKNNNASLNNPPSLNIYIVALKVPRKAQADKNIEAADIVSENSRLVETVFQPRIARLNWNYNERMRWSDPLQGGTILSGTTNGYNVHHYVDSLTIWNQMVDDEDANGNFQLVFKKVNFNETLDVLALVTGCKIVTPDFDYVGHAGIDKTTLSQHTSAQQITKDQLKKYGIEFRFAIPTTPYRMTVDHVTDQQQFAKIDPVTGILSSKLPNGMTDNRACVGKEPIIRIMLIDVKNNKLVDERYMKIKWVEKTKEPITLPPYTDTTTLKPCEDNKAPGVTWQWFINQVYAQIGDLGISQNTFAQIYQMTTADKIVPKDDVVYPKPHLSLLSPAMEPNGPVVKFTTNENGDALITGWTLSPAEIANIYPRQSKTFVATIKFKSILPTEYPDIQFDYKWTIKLPSLPVINGYYDNYWVDQYSHHDVMAVQYNTSWYNAIKAGSVVPGKEYGLTAPTVGMQLYNKANNKYYPGTDYCVFYNNMTNPFTYEIKSNKAQFIVKNLLGACSTWDMQFTWSGPDAVQSFMKWGTDNKWKSTSTNVVNNWGNSVSGLWGDPVINSVNQYQQYTGYRPASNTNSPALSKIGWKTAGAYKLETNAGAQALQLEWWGELKTIGNISGLPDQTDNTHIAWERNIKHNYNILYADHHNVANQALLNPLQQDNEADGWTPKRTHNKKLEMGIWGTINDWNIIPVKDYKFCLVEPLRINATLTGAFEEGYVSGTCIKNADAFAMRDFRGYEVKDQAAPANAQEKVKYRQELYRYYEVGTPVWDLRNVKYGMTYTNGSLKASNTDKLTAAQIELYTNGNIKLSVTQQTYNSEQYLVFRNNGGSNVEEEVWVYIPVSVDYGFGTVSTDIKVKLYPKGKAGNATIIPYPGVVVD